MAFSLAGPFTATVAAEDGVARWTPAELPGPGPATLVAVWTDADGRVAALAVDLVVA